MDLRHVWILVTGLAAVAGGLTGPLQRAAHPRNPLERAAHDQLVFYAALSIGGGAVLAAYALLTQ